VGPGHFIDVDPAWVVESTVGIASGADAARTLMGPEPRPTAVFAINDDTAVGALSSFEHLGLSVPEDVSLVGYTDIPIVSHLPTPLTSVRVPFSQIAGAAFELLISGPQGEHDRVAVAPPTLIPRRSTASAPAV
jgi:LacI family transcriptional regulator